jgi:hypothetical protein
MKNFIEALCFKLGHIFDNYEIDAELGTKFEKLITSEEMTEEILNELINIGISLEHLFDKEDAKLFDTCCKLALHLNELNQLEMGDLVIIGKSAYILGEIDYEDFSILIYTKNDDYSWEEITNLNFFCD